MAFISLTLAGVGDMPVSNRPAEVGVWALHTERQECGIESARIELQSKEERLFPDKLLYKIIYESRFCRLWAVWQARRRFTIKRLISDFATALEPGPG